MSIVLELAALLLVTVGAWWLLRRRYPLLRVAVTVVGLYAGLLGAVHGVAEIQQGSIRPEGVMIHAIGEPCQPEEVWHACFPALTLVPNMGVTGVLVLVVCAAMLVWVGWFIHRQQTGGQVLIGLSGVLLLVGGGFFPPFYGIIAGIVAWRLTPARNAV